MNIISKLMNYRRVQQQLTEDIDKGKPAVKRSSQWPTVQKKHLEENPACVACGSRRNVQVHHIRPFHLFPELELDPSNLISLCENNIDGKNTLYENHHLHLGHRGDFHKNNDCVLEDINEYRTKRSKIGLLKGYDMVTLKKLL